MAYNPIPNELRFLKSAATRFGHYAYGRDYKEAVISRILHSQRTELADLSIRLRSRNLAIMAAKWLSDQQDELEVGSAANVACLLSLMDDLARLGWQPFRENQPHLIELPPRINIETIPPTLRYLADAMKEFALFEFRCGSQLTSRQRAKLITAYDESVFRDHWPIGEAWPADWTHQYPVERRYLEILQDVIEFFEIGTRTESKALDDSQDQASGEQEVEMPSDDDDGDSSELESNPYLELVPDFRGLPDPITQFGELIEVICDADRSSKIRRNAVELLFACSSDSREEALSIVAGGIRVLLEWDASPPSTEECRQHLWRKCLRFARAWDIGQSVSKNIENWMTDPEPRSHIRADGTHEAEHYLDLTEVNERAAILLHAIKVHN